MSDHNETYGSITRNLDGSSEPYYRKSEGGSLTLKMLQDAFAAIERRDEEIARIDMEFARRMRPYWPLLGDGKHAAFFAAHRLVRASLSPDAALHPREYEEYLAILKAEGIDILKDLGDE